MSMLEIEWSLWYLQLVEHKTWKLQILFDTCPFEHLYNLKQCIFHRQLLEQDMTLLLLPRQWFLLTVSFAFFFWMKASPGCLLEFWFFLWRRTEKTQVMWSFQTEIKIRWVRRLDDTKSDLDSAKIYVG